MFGLIDYLCVLTSVLIWTLICELHINELMVVSNIILGLILVFDNSELAELIQVLNNNVV